MIRLYCLECGTVVGQRTEGSQGDHESSLAVCQTCGQHGARGAEARKANLVERGAADALTTRRISASQRVRIDCSPLLW